MNISAIVRELIRSGHYYVADKSLSLTEFETVCDIMQFDCTLEQNYFREGDWVITCPEILMARHQYFWHGQSVKPEIEVTNPTQWMDEWQHENNPTWRRS